MKVGRQTFDIILQIRRQVMESIAAMGTKLEKHLKLWEEGDISNLLHEGETIQNRISLKFKNMVNKGNVNGPRKLLLENMSTESCP